MKKGFTLIEMLVVISIIGILAGLTLTGIGTARKNARDTQRKSDLQQYKVTLEAYATNNNSQYPNRTYNGDSKTPSGIFDIAGPIIDEYLPTRIDDPVDTIIYRYEYQSDAGGLVYVLWAELETGNYWEICSNGKTGLVTTDEPTDENCDL